MTSSPRIIRTRDLKPAQAVHFRHPIKPEATDMYLHPISQVAGLERQVVSIARLPPNNESFLLHAHTHQEEFVFILEGTGIAVLGEEEHPVGPGDFIAYPCDGTPHQLRNNSDADLVYMMGGERTPFEVAHFPAQEMVGVFGADGVTMYKESEGRKLSFSDYTVDD